MAMPSHVPSAPWDRRRSPPEPPEHERRRVVDDRSPAGGAASELGDSSTNGSTMPRSYPATIGVAGIPNCSRMRSVSVRLCKEFAETDTAEALAGAVPDLPGRHRYALAHVTDMDDARRLPAWLLRPGWSVAVAVAVVGLPLVVARRRPAPAALVPGARPGDDRVPGARRRSRHTPLIGLPGRIGTYPDQGSHPGPLSFYLLAPTYRLLGSSSWALEAGTVDRPPRRHRHGVVDRSPAGAAGAASLAVAAAARRRHRRVRPAAADPAVEPVPAADGLDRRAAGHLGGAVRRSR